MLQNLPSEQKIADIITPALEHMGFELVRVRLMRGESRSVLQILLDRLDGTAVTIDGCTDASRQISALLEVEDPLDGAYVLEVSSAGMDRPLTNQAHFERFKGSFARIETDSPMAEDGRRKFSGYLRGVDGDDVIIECEDQTYKIPYERLKSAKLAVSEVLFKPKSKDSGKYRKGTKNG